MMLVIVKHADEEGKLRGVSIGSLNEDKSVNLTPPDSFSISTAKVSEGVSEGWVTISGESPVHRPGGPPGNEWAVTHTFRQAKELVFHTEDGDVTYKVTHQPDKYVEDGSDTDSVTPDIYADGNTRVDWFYEVEKDG